MQHYKNAIYQSTSERSNTYWSSIDTQTGHQQMIESIRTKEQWNTNASLHNYWSNTSETSDTSDWANMDKGDANKTLTAD